MNDANTMIREGKMSGRTLEGAVVTITGANGGIGQEYVRQALDRGARKVYATARSPRDWNHEGVVGVRLDVLDAVSIAHAVESTNDTTILVNNAGIYPPVDSLLHGRQDEFRAIFDTNFFGAVEVVRAYAPVLARNGGGSVVNVHSSASWRAGNGAYSASKAALWSATNALRLELARQQTHVLAVHMGLVDTPMVAHHTEPDKADPADIARATYDGLESGEFEVLADDDARAVKRKLAEGVDVMYPTLLG